MRTAIDTHSLAKDPLDSAINSAQQYLLSEQNNSDGHWVGILEADTTLTSDYIMLMHFLGKIDHEKQGKAVNLLREHQLPDGGWNIYYGGPRDNKRIGKGIFCLEIGVNILADEPLCRRQRSASLIWWKNVNQLFSDQNLSGHKLGQADWHANQPSPLK